MRLQGGFVPVRESKLTMLLKGALTAPSADHDVTTIACISPCSCDTEHTLNTVRNALAMAGSDAPPPAIEIPLQLAPRAAGGTLPAHPKEWSRCKVLEWLQGLKSAELRGCADKLPEASAGKDLLRWPQLRFNQLAGSAEGGRELRELFVAQRDHAAAAAEEARQQRTRRR